MRCRDGAHTHKRGGEGDEGEASIIVMKFCYITEAGSPALSLKCSKHGTRIGGARARE